MVDKNYVLGRWRWELDRPGEDHNVRNRHIRNHLLQRSSAAFILNKRIQKAPPKRAINIGPLWLIFSAEDDAVIVLGLNAEYAACGKNCMVNLYQTAVRAWQYEIVQHIGTAGSERSSNAHLADLARDNTHDMAGDRAKYEG